MGEISRAPFILGVLIFAAGVLWPVSQWHFRGRAVHVKGQVVDVVVEITTKQTRLFYPVVEFTSAGGEQVRFKERVGITGSPLFDKGESVPVCTRRAIRRRHKSTASPPVGWGHCWPPPSVSCWWA